MNLTKKHNISTEFFFTKMSQSTEREFQNYILYIIWALIM